jgi:hypothetical protein
MRMNGSAQADEHRAAEDAMKRDAGAEDINVN